MWRSVLKGKSLGAVRSLKLLLLGIFSNSNSAVLYFLWSLGFWGSVKKVNANLHNVKTLKVHLEKCIEWTTKCHSWVLLSFFFIYFLNCWVYYGCFIIIKHRKNTIAIIDSCMYYMHCVAKSSLFRSADLHVHVHVYHNIFWFKLGFAWEKKLEC